MYLFWTALSHLQTLGGGPPREAVPGLSNERRLKVDGGIGGVGEHTASVKTLHRGAKTGANLEDL
jgi:hypothetical protein